MKVLINLILCVFPFILLSVTRTVSLDGTQQYTSIQSAINASINGDVVLVYPGQYLENLNMSNKSSITLGSLEYATGDTTYINTTIIDGSNGNNSTILCYENTVNCTIRGFSITGGTGYDYFNGSSAYQIFGGGIFFNTNNSVSLINLNIHDNKASIGGGIAIFALNTVNMNNVNMYHNVARYYGGGLDLGSDPNDGQPNVVFDQVNRCSIYNNFAQWGLDIHWHFIHGGSLAVYLKKFTVPQWERYYADYYDSTYPPSPYTVFDVQEAYVHPVDADLYVSPDGDDDNDGLSQFTPLKTPSVAMQRIASVPANPRTVHLLAGEHHNTFAGEYIPISIKSFTILQGVSETDTKLYGENMIEGTGVVSMGIESYGMTLKNLSITTDSSSAVFAWGVHDFIAENVTIENSTVKRWFFLVGYMTSTMTLSNITMRNNTASWSDYGFRLQGSTITMDNILMQDNGVPDMPLYWYQRGCGGFDIFITDSLIIKNSKFINNTHYSEDGYGNFRVYTDDIYHPVVTFDNCLFAYNHSYSGVREIMLWGTDFVNLINCTFANNFTNFSEYIQSSCVSSRIVNCLFSNNTSFPYEIKTSNNTVIENCLFSRTANIWTTYNGAALQWGEHNLTGTDPLFVGGDQSSPSYYYLCDDDTHGYSPALNAGTTDSSILPVGYEIPQYDAFGFARIFGSGIDIGCYESPGYTDNADNTIPEIEHLTISPNPFKQRTSFRYALNQSDKVGQSSRIDIYNLKGQKVRTLTNKTNSMKEQVVTWDGYDDKGKSCSTGIYLVNLTVDGKQISSKKVTLIR